MARPSGIRNPGYEEKRDAFLDTLTKFVMEQGVRLPSLRQLAIAAETSEPTLKHYFEDRTGVIIAIIERMGTMSDTLRDRLSAPAENIEIALSEYGRIASRLSSDAGYMNSHIFAIREGMVEESIFEAYNRVLVEPAISSIAQRLVKSKGGPVNYSTARVAADMLMSCAMMMALRRVVVEADTPQTGLDREYQLMINWITQGLIADPDGTSKAAA